MKIFCVLALSLAFVLFIATLLFIASVFSSSTKKNNDKPLIEIALLKAIDIDMLRIEDIHIHTASLYLDMKVEKSTIQCYFDSVEFDQLVDATQLLDNGDELDDDNALVAQDNSLASGSNATIIHVEDSLDGFLTRDVAIFMVVISTSWFLSRYRSLRRYMKRMRSDMKTQRKGSLGLSLVCAILLLTVLVLLTRGAKATLASPVRNEVDLLSSCNGAGDTGNPTTIGNHTVTACSSCPSLYHHSSTTGTEMNRNSSHNGHLCPSCLLGQPSSGVCDPIKIMDSLKEAFCLLKISPGLFSSCAPRVYPFVDCMKGILKQFCLVAVVEGEPAMLDSSNSSSNPKQDWKAAPSSLPSTLLNRYLAFAVFMLIIVRTLTLFVFWCGTRHIYNETGPVAEKVITLPNPVDSLSDAYRANAAMHGIKPTKSCIRVGDSGNVFYYQQPSPVGLTLPSREPVQTQPEMHHRQGTTTIHTTEMVGIMGWRPSGNEGSEVNPASRPRATAAHGCVVPYGLQVFAAPGGDDSQQT